MTQNIEVNKTQSLPWFG